MTDDRHLPPLHAALQPGNRAILTDLFVSQHVKNEPQQFAFKVYIRLNAMKQTRFQNVSFQHSIFESAYFNRCVFSSCDFTGCRFIGCNFHQSAFSGCRFDYATFERCQIDDDILDREAPGEENLKMRFARTLRMNFQQTGDAKAVNKAILLELEATATYLKKSWLSSETYYREKYPGWKKVRQFIKWMEFCMLDFIWGNGESTLKLMRTMVLVHAAIAIYDTAAFHDVWSLRDYLGSLVRSPGVFLGSAVPAGYPIWISSSIVAVRLIGVAFLTAILVKRFGRR